MILFVRFYSVEIGHVLASVTCRGLSTLPLFFSAKVMVYVTVVWCTLRRANDADGGDGGGGAFSVEAVFVLIAVFSAVRGSLQLFIPLAITCLAEVQVTLGRIKVRLQPAAVYLFQDITCLL